MKKIVRSFAAILPAQYNVALLIVFFGAISLASSFGQCPAPYTLSANTPSENATPVHGQHRLPAAPTWYKSLLPVQRAAMAALVQVAAGR